MGKGTHLHYRVSWLGTCFKDWLVFLAFSLWFTGVTRGVDCNCKKLYTRNLHGCFFKSSFIFYSVLFGGGDESCWFVFGGGVCHLLETIVEVSEFVCACFDDGMVV